MSYLQLTVPAFNTYEIKKSLFHAAVYPITSREDAMQALAAEKLKYPDARHHCWAYLLGAPNQPNNQGYNDDGEPSGTAGKPMLNVLSHGEFGNIVIIISRYFGGTKLGAGGLVRAYSQATKDVLELANGTPFIARQTYHLVCTFQQEPWLRQQAQIHDVVLSDFTYTQHVQCTALIPIDKQNSFSEFCQNQQITLTQPDQASSQLAVCHQI